MWGLVTEWHYTLSKSYDIENADEANFGIMLQSIVTYPATYPRTAGAVANYAFSA